MTPGLLSQILAVVQERGPASLLLSIPVPCWVSPRGDPGRDHITFGLHPGTEPSA